MKNILINVDNTLLENSKNEDSIIQQDAYSTCIKLLEQKLELANSYSIENFDRYHETITVQGERGTGKTSFILSVKYIVDTADSFNKLSNIKALDVLDPTLLGDRQKVLLTIISNVKDTVDYHINNSNLIDESKVNNWKNSLLNLAEGLNSIINIGNNPTDDSLWDDSGLALEFGLKKSKAGVNFEKEFHKYIYQSLQILNKKAFLLILDDIDTDFTKGWDVLEILRKYITTPHIITIISGDLDLYTNLIRKEKWELFSKLIEYEKEMETRYKNSLNNLQEQYLIKILQPQNFINLYRLNYYITYKNNDYLIKIKNSNNESVKINLFLENMFEDLFSVKGKKLQSYINIFLSMPIRTNIQIFKAYFDVVNKIEYTDETFTKFKPLEVKQKKYFFQKLKDIFISTFFKYEVDLQFLELIRENDSIENFIYKFSQNKKIYFSEISTLIPESNSQQKNIFISILSALYDTYYKNDYSKQLEWILKINILNEVFFLSQEQTDQVKKFLSLDQKLSTNQRILRFSALLQDKKFLFASTYMKDVQVHGEERTFKKLLNEINEINEKKFFLLLIHNKIKPTLSTTQDRFSFLYILSFIQNLYSLNEIKDFNLNEEIKRYALTLSSENERTILVPKLAEQNEDDIEDSHDYFNDGSLLNEEFLKRLKIWIENNKINSSKLSLSELSNMFSKYVKRSIDKIKYTSFNNLNEYLSVSIYNFFNELLINSFYSKSTNLVNFDEIKNYEKAHEKFMSNLNKYSEEFPLNDYNDIFTSLLTCPVWEYYLENYNDVKEKLEGDSYVEQSISIPIVDELKKLTLHGTPMSKELFLVFLEEYDKEKAYKNKTNAEKEKSLKKIQSERKFKNKYQRKFPSAKIKEEAFAEYYTFEDMIL